MVINSTKQECLFHTLEYLQSGCFLFTLYLIRLIVVILDHFWWHMIYQRHKKYHKMPSNILWHPHMWPHQYFYLLEKPEIFDFCICCRHFGSKFTTNHILSKQKQRMSKKALNETRFMVSLWSLINNTLVWVEVCGYKIVNQLYISQIHLNIKNQRASYFITFILTFAGAHNCLGPSLGK